MSVPRYLAVVYPVKSYLSINLEGDYFPDSFLNIAIMYSILVIFQEKKEDRYDDGA